MEHVIAAPHDGRVKELKVKKGDRVAAGEDVAELEAAP
jgi:biotin carboxyl carrier protein